MRGLCPVRSRVPSDLPVSECRFLGIHEGHKRVAFKSIYFLCLLKGLGAVSWSTSNLGSKPISSKNKYLEESRGLFRSSLNSSSMHFPSCSLTLMFVVWMAVFMKFFVCIALSLHLHGERLFANFFSGNSFWGFFKQKKILIMEDVEIFSKIKIKCQEENMFTYTPQFSIRNPSLFKGEFPCRMTTMSVHSTYF